MTTPRYRHALPQLSGQPMLTDGGLETTLIFHDGLDLPLFASFALFRSEEGVAALRRYFDPTPRPRCRAAWASSPTRRPGAPAATGATGSASMRGSWRR